MTDNQLIASLKKVQDNIQTTMAELASLKQEMLAQSLKEERSRVFKFIEDSKKAGFTTDLSTMEEFIEKKFGLTKGKATALLIDYIETTASSLSQLSLPMTPVQVATISSPVVASSVKRKGPKPYSEMTPEELAIAKASKVKKPEVTVETQITLPVVSSEDSTPPLKEKRVIGVKKISDASKVWYSFLKTVQAEMEATGEKPKYEDVLKKAKEMKDGDKEAYQLFSSTWTPDDQVTSN